MACILLPVVLSRGGRRLAAMFEDGCSRPGPGAGSVHSSERGTRRASEPLTDFSLGLEKSLIKYTKFLGGVAIPAVFE